MGTSEVDGTEQIGEQPEHLAGHGHDGLLGLRVRDAVHQAGEEPQVLLVERTM
jgi:hypothetical protein